MIGYAGLGNIIDFTTVLHQQLQLAADAVEPAGRPNRSGTSTTLSPGPSSTTTTANTTLWQFVNAQLMKNVANRPHAVNFNFGYDFPTAALQRR